MCNSSHTIKQPTIGPICSRFELTAIHLLRIYSDVFKRELSFCAVFISKFKLDLSELSKIYFSERARPVLMV